MRNKPRSKAKSLEGKIETSSEDTSPYVFQRDKIKFDLTIKELPWTDKQKEIINLIRDKKTKVVFLSGPAGTSKSILATYCGLKALNEKKVSEIIYIRSVIESASKSLGFLPGEAELKMKPFAAPLIDKMEELLPASCINKLLNEERVKPIPINFLRGSSFNANFIIADEMQNAEFSEIQTIITRIGNFSKFIFCGDPMQTDIKEKTKSGFKPIYDIFNNDESKNQGIFCVELGKEDIVRSEILKFIVEKLEIYKN
jgi:phosphate starvation-inducible protein PhoH and related proteins